MDLNQEQIEALIRLMLVAKYQDKNLSIAEDGDFHKRVGEFPWQSGESLDLFLARSTAKVREGISSPEKRAEFLAEQCAALRSPEARHVAVRQIAGVLQSDGMGDAEAALIEELEPYLK